MINISQEKLLIMLLSSLALGVAFGIFYELIRLLRVIIAPQKMSGMSLSRLVSDMLTFFADFVFILLFAIAAILQTYKITDGVFRGLTYIGMSLGFLFYYFVVGRLTKKISENIARIIKKTIRALARLIFVPFKKIFLLFFRIYTLTIGRFIGKIKSEIKKKRVLNKITSEGIQDVVLEVEKENSGYKKEGRISFGGQRIV